MCVVLSYTWVLYLKLFNVVHFLGATHWRSVYCNHATPFLVIFDTFSYSGDQKYWSRNNSPVQPVPYLWYYRPPTADVEMTGYALLAILKYNANRNIKKHFEPLQIVKWLSQQQTSFGGFTSTQVTHKNKRQTQYWGEMLRARVQSF